MRASKPTPGRGAGPIDGSEVGTAPPSILGGKALGDNSTPKSDPPPPELDTKLESVTPLADGVVGAFKPLPLVMYNSAIGARTKTTLASFAESTTVQYNQQSLLTDVCCFLFFSHSITE